LSIKHILIQSENTTLKKTIIVSAYAIAPNKGSEYGVGWNFVNLLKEQYNVIVLYGTSGDRLGDNSELERYLENNKVNNVHFQFVKPNKLVSFIDSINHAGLTPIFYLAYKLWQKQVYRKAKEIVASQDIFLVHQLNAIGFREPGYLWKLNKPFVWGPVGGTYQVPEVLLSFVPQKQKFAYKLRNYSNLLQLQHSKRLKKVFKSNGFIFSSTTDDSRNFFKYYQRTTGLLAENHIQTQQVITDNLNEHKAPKDVVNLLWCGRIDGGKALIILIEALKRIESTNWKLSIIGDGPLRKQLEEVVSLSAFSSRVEWLGQLPRGKVLEHMSKSDLHVLTSIKDTNPTVLLEAMSVDLPTLCIDHCGMSSLVSERTGIKIKITTRENILAGFSLAIETVLNNPGKLQEFSNNLKLDKANFCWSNASLKLQDYYKSAEQNFLQLQS
jgi:glycosyltransferase involved in cell wall biosynthesis